MNDECKSVGHILLDYFTVFHIFSYCFYNYSFHSLREDTAKFLFIHSHKLLIYMN